MADMSDLEILCAMLARAGIAYRVDSEQGWTRRIVLQGDRCLVFDREHGLCGMRSEDDLQSFDGN